ncbi:hypothetical protein MASR2M66_18720 [Chloroflexota bacterium]
MIENYLTILVGTYNRLDLLKKTLYSIQFYTNIPHKVIVIDGGSDDGTVEYLRSRQDIVPVFQGKLLGASRAYNEVWRDVKCKYTCWLSDDTELVGGGLDLAVQILESNKTIGMVSLKTRDVEGQWKHIPYTGALSEYGVLNCNHGVLRLGLLRSLGYFNENYRTYLIDPDLTASVLCAGKKVVTTKDVFIHHHREWADENWENKVQETMNGVDHYKIYLDKFVFLQKRTLADRGKKWLARIANLPFISFVLKRVWNLNSRDWLNLTQGRFIRLTDVLRNKCNPFHNVQCIPVDVLHRPGNPYKYLLKENV